MKRTIGIFLISLLAGVGAGGLVAGCAVPVETEVTKTESAVLFTNFAAAPSTQGFRNVSAEHINGPFSVTETPNSLGMFAGRSYTNPVPSGPAPAGFTWTELITLQPLPGEDPDAHGSRWSLTFAVTGPHGMFCNAVAMRHTVSFFSNPPIYGFPVRLAIRGVDGLTTFAGNQNYWYNDAPVTCTNWRQLPATGGNRFSPRFWTKGTTTFQIGALAIVEGANSNIGLPLSIANTPLGLIINPQNLPSQSEYVSQRHNYTVRCGVNSCI